MVGDDVVCSEEVRAKDRDSNNNRITDEWITKCLHWLFVTIFIICIFLQLHSLPSIQF